MASYRILIKPSAAKELEAVSRPDRERIAERIRTLAGEPRPHGVQKLTGGDRYRIRQGDYRILYEIHDADIVVIVVRIGHRREVYRG